MNKIILFEDYNFGGNSFEVRGEDPNLIPQHWNKKASSVIVISGDWEMYQNVNYQGDSWKVSAKGGPEKDGAYPDPSNWQGTNDSISSLKSQ